MMRVIAFLFFSLFVAVLTIPAINSFSADSEIALFTPDEEKESEEKKIDKIEEEKDNKTEYNSFTLSNFYSLDILFTQVVDRSVKELPTPIIDKITPPPNVGC